MQPQDNIFYQGDTIELEFYLYKAYISELDNVPWDLINHKIIFELKNRKDGIILKKLNSEAGGDNSQITLLAEIGHFKVFISATESAIIVAGDYIFGIKVVTLDNEVFTVGIEPFRLLPEKIKQ
jgi:hypothetical protein